MANIKEIAKAAGVSVATVSRVLNGHPYVSEAKRRAVGKAMEQLQYARNMNAVHLIKGTTEKVGVILPQINYAYFAQLMEGIAEGALRHNYQLMLCQTGYRPEEEMKVLRMLRKMHTRTRFGSWEDEDARNGCLTSAPKSVTAGSSPTGCLG